MILKIKTSSGWRTIDSPYDPEEEAVKSLGNSFDSQISIVLIGAGSGYLLTEILKKGINDIVLITPYRAVAEQNYSILSDYESRDGNAYIILADVFDINLQKRLSETLEQRNIKKVVFHPRESKTFPQFFNPLSVYIESLNKKINFKRQQNCIKRVLFPCSGQIIEKEIIKEFVKRGVEVFDTESFNQRKIDPKSAWEIISRYEPDLIMSTNNKGSDFEGYIPAVCSMSGVKWATWFLDDPRFILSKNEIYEEQNRYGFCWDVSGTEALTEIGFGNISMLPLATDPDMFYPGEGDEKLEGRIIYVGSPGFGNEERYFSGLDKNHTAIDLCKYFEEKLFSERKIPSVYEIYAAINELNIINNFTEAELDRLPAYTLYKANLNYRIKALNELAGLNPIVYGEGWGGLLSDNIELRDYIDYYRELPKIYRSDAVQISLTHLQMRHYPNQRIFDVGACAGVVVGDRVTGWNELFTAELDELVFDNFNELKQKASRFAQSKDLRRAYGEKLRIEVLSKHTYAHRIDTVINKL
jgi:spore maturation protein CgeB